MSKGLEALEKLGEMTLESEYGDEPKVKGLVLYDIIEKELKALDIIVKKANIRLYHLNCSDRYYFKTTNNLYEISKEKYDLLKEVLL